MSKAKNSILIARLKYNSTKLRANYQIPLQLHILICSLNVDSTEKQINYLMMMSEHFMRVRGYWKKHRDLEKNANEQIKDGYMKL